MEDGLVKRTKRNFNFTQIDNDLLSDKRMSLDTKGLLCYILSKPDNWIIYKKQLMKEFNIGRTMMDRLFKEMETSGYLVVSRMLRGDDGSFKGNAYLFYDTSIYTDARNLTTDNLTTDFPTTENHTTNNTILETILNNNNKDNNIQARKKSKKKDTEIPTFDMFEKYALEKKPNVNVQELKKKYDSWIMNDWHDGNGSKIVSWTSKLNNTLPYIKENVSKPLLPVREKTRDDFWNEAQYKEYCLKNNLEYKTNE